MKLIKNILTAVGGLFILLMVIFAVTGGGKKAEDDAGATSGEATGSPVAVAGQPAEAPAEQAAPRPELTAAALVAAYEENTVAADNQYKGKPLDVTGVVSSINTDMFGDAYITFKAGNEFMPPQAKFTDKQAVANLKKGAKVKVSCVGAGDIAKTPMLKDCSLI